MGIDPLNRAVFLDRDGVLNENVFYADTGAYESPRTADDFRLLPVVLDSLRRLEDAGFLLFIVSNQPNVAKGKSTLQELGDVHRALLHELDAADIQLTDAFYCFHHPDSTVPVYGAACQCRKPSPFFLLEAQQRYGIDLAASWMVGDRETDVLCGLRAGVSTIRVQAPEAQKTPVVTAAAATVRSLPEAALVILGRLAQQT